MRSWTCRNTYTPVWLRRPDNERQLPAAPTQVERSESITQLLRSCAPGFHEHPGFRRGCLQFLPLNHEWQYWLWVLAAALEARIGRDKCSQLSPSLLLQADTPRHAALANFGELWGKAVHAVMAELGHPREALAKGCDSLRRRAV